jgi:hypothetical protein
MSEETQEQRNARLAREEASREALRAKRQWSAALRRRSELGVA